MSVPTEDELRRARIRAVIREFFRDKPPGTTITDEQLAKYREDLRRATRRAGA
jgi:hypothetical protein